jgi:uncharacterized repeat protein (TIGR03803 family)
LLLSPLSYLQTNLITHKSRLSKQARFSALSLVEIAAHELQCLGAASGYRAIAGNAFHVPVISNNAGTVFKLSPDDLLTVLYTFCPTGTCVDGLYPEAGLSLDEKGNLYGTTFQGGTGTCPDLSGCGVVFKVTPKGKETVLHSFTGGTDGAAPFAAVTMDTKGNLYGTTGYGGGATACGQIGCGTVFEIARGGTEKVLWAFNGTTTGSMPLAGVIADKKGNLYGTTEGGGVFNSGEIFKVTPGGHETILYSFCRQGNCADGSSPEAGLISDAAGNLYGTTATGGQAGCGDGDAGCGTVFELKR